MPRELQPPVDPTEPPPFVHRRIPGSLVIAVLLVIGGILAGVGWWSHHVEIYRPRQLWGADHALRIRDARAAEAWLLEPLQGSPAEQAADAALADDVVTIAGQPYKIVKRRDAIAVRGVSDVRRALIADFAFDWEHPPRREAGGWQFALVMTDATGRTAVAFAPADRQVTLLETGAEANVTPVGDFFAAFFRRALELPEPKDDRTGKDAR